MKSTLVAVVLVLSVAAAAIAAPHTSKPNGPLNLWWDAAGNGWIANDGAAPFLFDGYTILSASGILPADVQGINDNSWADPNFAATLGLTMQQATAFQEMSFTASNYSEVTMNIGATLQPGGVIPLGGGFLAMGLHDYTFTYVDSTTGGSWEGYLIPEPATMSLLALGGLAALRRRSR